MSSANHLGRFRARTSAWLRAVWGEQPTGKSRKTTGNPSFSHLEILEPRQLLSSIAISNGVLTMTGDPGVTNQFTLWVSDDHTQSWAIINGQQQQFNYNSFNSIKIIENSSSDSVTIDARNNKPVATTTLSSMNSGGSATTGAQTGNSNLPAGISVSNGVLNMVGTAGMTNQFTLWVSDRRDLCP